MFADALNIARDTKRGRDALKGVSVGELGRLGAGAALGGGTGYLLSKLLHKDPSTKIKLLYSLLGAAAGGGGMYGYLGTDADVEGFKGTKRDVLRLGGEANRLLDKALDKHRALHPETDPTKAGEYSIFDSVLHPTSSKLLNSAIVGGAASLPIGWSTSKLTDFLHPDPFFDKQFRVTRDINSGLGATDLLTRLAQRSRHGNPTPAANRAAQELANIGTTHGVNIDVKDILPAPKNRNNFTHIWDPAQGRIGRRAMKGAKALAPYLLSAALTGTLHYFLGTPDSGVFTPRLSPDDIRQVAEQEDK